MKGGAHSGVNDKGDERAERKREEPHLLGDRSTSKAGTEIGGVYRQVEH